MKKKKDSQEPESTEEKIRKERKFSLAEALGREAAGSLSGASPVARTDQVLLEVEHLLETHLPDSSGSLTRTILAHLELDPPLLARHFDEPAEALVEYLERTLGSAILLEGLVRDADARWGREYGERPHFETGEKPPHPDDPYTRAGVRELLEDLVAILAADNPD